MKYRIRRVEKDVQLVIYEDNFLTTFTGQEELKELIKYAKIALNMEDDPRKPRADLRIVK